MIDIIFGCFIGAICLFYFTKDSILKKLRVRIQPDDIINDNMTCSIISDITI
jgi:hypothetical protein